SVDELRHFGGVFAYTAVYAPRSLSQAIVHVWRRDGAVVDSVELSPVQGGRQEGFRTFSHKTNFPADPAGRWSVDVMTSSGQLFDTHAHLQFPEFAADLDDVLARARGAGVTQLVTVGTDVETSRAAVELAARDPDIFAAVGVHPHDAAQADEDALAEIERLAHASPKVVAIGETGLDFFRNLSPPDAQERAFRWQLGLARRPGKPVLVH